MIIHRTLRDVAKCRNKYGEAWKQYEQAVPYLYIPVRISSKVYLCAPKANDTLLVHRVIQVLMMEVEMPSKTLINRHHNTPYVNKSLHG